MDAKWQLEEFARSQHTALARQTGDAGSLDVGCDYLMVLGSIPNGAGTMVLLFLVHFLLSAHINIGSTLNNITTMSKRCEDLGQAR